MSLVVDIRMRRGSLAIDARFAVASGETVALLGPNGAGKTTCLLAIAGLLRIDDGLVALFDRTLDSGQAGAFVEPAARQLGVVFQDPLLFPRLCALDNVAFGLRARGVSRAASRDAAARWLSRIGVAPALHAALPARLSGGQAQKVALARALASEPRGLLLDEPFAAVDVSARAELRRELRAYLADFAGPRVVVVHDIADALAIADRIVVLEGGHVVQSGHLEDLLQAPRSRFVADLVGINCFFGSCRGGVVELPGASFTVASAIEGEVVVTVHPRAVALFRERPVGTPRNVWLAPIVALEPTLERVRVQLGGVVPIVAEVTPAAVREMDLRLGSEVWVAVKATEALVAAR